MHFSYLDAYYHLATLGDKGAFDLLYKGVMLRAITQVEAAGFQMQKHTEISANFEQYVDELFFKMLNNYEAEKGTFTAYVEYVMKARVINEVKRLYSVWKSGNADVDFDEAEHAMASVNEYSDESSCLRREIEVSNFKYKIASGKQKITLKKLRQNKIMLMIYAGYSAADIRKKLHLSKSQYRTQIAKIKKDEDVLNLKFELK